ncbi:hypothetical protein [Tsukamurella ocularis]|uniref:hypothetical protein n=1 Tax=Tsukamurella ocularis TaxID=1970234 RepID=UPI002167B717|nr:hypothetical protein [Tsukamurella ocularis]MCS3781431.1 hypothetical protein [Tsukamurella ocularis]MCS3787803.1 hypothetical protein [Tsukamurella ocularis]MCS3851097.1 hypothetical protein [Tsukamurella ocularis]
MSKRAETETRTVPVAVLKAFAGALLILWLTLGAVFMLVDWPVGGPASQRVAYGLMFVANLVLVTTAAQLWRTAIGMEPQTSASDAHYMLGGIALVIPVMALMWMDYGDWAPWRIAAVVVLFAAMIVLAVLNFRDRRRRKGEVMAPIAAMTVRTARGDREVRIAQPEGLHNRWMTHWSIGTPQGVVHRVSYGPDPMRSLTAALADAEAATAVI